MANPWRNIKTIKLPGGTELEIQQQIKEMRQELETDLGQLRQKVQVTTDMARFSMDAASRDGRFPRADWDQRISDLKKQYNLLRQQRSGRERALEMTRIGHLATSKMA